VDAISFPVLRGLIQSLPLPLILLGNRPGVGSRTTGSLKYFCLDSLIAQTCIDWPTTREAPGNW